MHASASAPRAVLLKTSTWRCATMRDQTTRHAGARAGCSGEASMRLTIPCEDVDMFPCTVYASDVPTLCVQSVTSMFLAHSYASSSTFMIMFQRYSTNSKQVTN